jgi:hypothetical protein
MDQETAKKLVRSPAKAEELSKKPARRLAKSENGGGSGGIEEGTQAKRSGPEVQTYKHTHTHKHTHTSHWLKYTRE